MNDKIFVSCAVTGSGDTASKHPDLPKTPEQIAKAAIEAAKAGAAIAHIHVRENDGKPSRRLELYKEVVDRVRSSDTDVILNLTTGMGGDLDIGQGKNPLEFGPLTDMANVMERIANAYLGLPEDLKWPRNKKGHLRHPKSWTKKFLRKHYSEEYLQPLSFLRKLVFVEYEVVIDIPKHAFFFIKAAQVPFSLVQIERAYACAELLKRLCQYDRFRLLTITTPRMAVGLDKIDKAIFWPELGRKRWIFG